MAVDHITTNDMFLVYAAHGGMKAATQQTMIILVTQMCST